MTKEEQRRLQRQKEREQRDRDRAAWEAARGPMDLPFLLLAMVLLTIGLIMVLSASFPSAASSETSNFDPLYYFKRQAAFGALGVAAMFWMSKIIYQRLRGVAKLALIVSVILLILVVLPGPNKYGKLFGIRRNNSVRWMKLFLVAGPQFQPSEVAKLGIILYFAATISKKREKMRTFKDGILPYAVILVGIAGLMWMEPHLSGMILLLGAYCLIGFFARRGEGEEEPEVKLQYMGLRETAALGCALTVNNVGLGVGASIAGLGLWLTVLASAACSFLFLYVGNRLGKSWLSEVIGGYAEPISGVMMITLGLFELLG